MIALDNERGVSYIFGPDVISNFLKKNDMDLVCRAHQVVEEGYEFFAKRQLVTLFSAPNYCGEFDNSGNASSDSRRTDECGRNANVFFPDTKVSR